jgi:serine/threonine protein kinase
VRLYGYFYDSNYVFLVYELITNGTLFQHIKNVRLNEEEASNVLLIFKIPLVCLSNFISFELY